MGPFIPCALSLRNRHVGHGTGLRNHNLGMMRRPHNPRSACAVRTDQRAEGAGFWNADSESGGAAAFFGAPGFFGFFRTGAGFGGGGVG
jgi:hypothetical protein